MHAKKRDRSILKNMSVEPLIERNFRTVKPEDTLGEFVRQIEKSRRNIFPVVNAARQFQGIVLLDDVREIMFDTELYDQTLVRDLMHHPPDTVDIKEPMEQVMEKFEYHNAWNLPVLDQGRYIGFVSKSSIFNRYRQLLIDRSRET